MAENTQAPEGQQAQVDIMTVVSMAHDTSLVLNLLGNKIQEGIELTEDDLKSIPTIAGYSNYLMRTVLQFAQDQNQSQNRPQVSAPQTNGAPKRQKKS